MKVEKTNIEGVLIIEPKVFGDERGYFFESFNSLNFKRLTGIDVDFVQDNQSKSGSDVLRGLHFQEPPFAQDKLVRVITGSVLDVVVDIRKDSPTYGNYFSITLDAIKHKMLWIPRGMAHGFLSLESDTIFSYKCTEFYHPEVEGCILWDDADLAINWNIKNPLISDKDKVGMPFSKFISKF
jgi:dTDP-4-dehydrorhamnose 3,5-epimerase